jgi:hypothetical protein
MAQGSLIRTIDTSIWNPPSPDPSGIAYIPGTNRLLVSDAEVDEIPTLFQGSNLFESSITGSLIRTGTTQAYSSEPAGLDINPANGHLFVSDDNPDRVFELSSGSDGLYGTSDDVIVRTIALRTLFNINDPEGVAYNALNNTLLIAGGLDDTIYEISLPSSGTPQLVNTINATALGVTDPEGIEFDPDTGYIYLVGVPRNNIAVFTLNGTLVQTINFSATNLRKPAGLALAPSTQDSSSKSLFIVDRRVDNNINPDENDGGIYEVQLPPPPINQPPSVNAGDNQEIVSTASATLDGTVSDDGLPNGTLTTSWTKVSGPGTVTFGNANDVDTSASFSAPGTYQLQLAADDSALTGSDLVEVVVSPLPPTNVAPSVNAGDDQTVVFTSPATLDATVADDGLPNPPGALT